MSENKWTFVRSSFCVAGACVEVGLKSDKVMVRDSQTPEQMLIFTPDEWRAFVLGVKAGEFDPA